MTEMRFTCRCGAATGAITWHCECGLHTPVQDEACAAGHARPSFAVAVEMVPLAEVNRVRGTNPSRWKITFGFEHSCGVYRCLVCGAVRMRKQISAHEAECIEMAS